MKRSTLLVLMLFSSFFISAQNYSVTLMNITGSNSITCVTTSVNLIATNNYTAPASYVWAGPASLTGSNVLLTVPGMYTVTATSGSVIMTQTFLLGTYTAMPTGSISPNAQSIACNSNSAQFVAVANPSPGAFSITHSITSPYGGSVTFTTTSLYNSGGPGTYTYVLINNLSGCFITQTFTVNAPTGFPTYSIVSPQNFTLGCNSKSVAVIAITNAQTTPINGGAVSYTLLPPGSPSATGTGSLASYTVTTPGVYTVITKDNNSLCETRVPVSVILNNAAPSLTAVVPTQILNCNTSSVQLQAYSATTGGTFQWQYPGNPGTFNGGIYTVNSNTAAPTSTLVANYTLVVTNSVNACTSSSVIPVYQNLFPPIPKISNGGQSGITCYSDSIILTNQSLSGIPPGPFPNNGPVVGFQWSGPTPQVPLSLLSIYTAYVAGVYTLVAKDMNNGCTATTVMTISDNRNYPVVNNPTAPPPFCFFGSPVTISPIIMIPGPVLLYAWTAPGSPTVAGTNSFTANAPGIYTVVVTNSVNGCASAGQLTVMICGGINENKDRASSMTLFPNPGKGEFFVQTNSIAKNKYIEIYSVLGVLVKQQTLSSENVLVDLKAEASGVYIVYLLEEGQVTETLKIIKE